MEQGLETEYKEVPQDWIDEHDLTQVNSIVFYDDEKKIVTDFDKHKTKTIKSPHINGEFGHIDTIKKDGLKLQVKTSDYEALYKYVIDMENKKKEEAETEEKNIINNNKLIINSIKDKLIAGVKERNFLTDNYKEKFVKCITTAATNCENNLEEYSDNAEYFLRKILLRKFLNYINQELKDDLIFDSKKITEPIYDNENINVAYDMSTIRKTQFENGILFAYTIKIKVPHIIFIYDFDSEEIIELRTNDIINHEYKYQKYNPSVVVVVDTTSQISTNSKNIEFYIYKSELNTEIAMKSNPPLSSGFIHQIRRYLQCFNGFCGNAGGKRTQKNKKNKKTKKQNKKVFRKIKSFRKIRKR